ncbi:MAG: MBL fold metallo-hydrolase [Vicinamibacteria bacterium]
MTWTRRPSRCRIAGFLVAALLVGRAFAAAPPLPSIAIAPQFAVDVPGLSLWWTGNAGWLVRSKDILIGFDLVLEKEPFLDEFSMDVRYERPIRSAQLANLDYSFISHAHGDHFARETSKILLRESRCRFVLPRSCLKVADELGIPPERRIVAVPGETLRLPGLVVEPIHAIHGDRFGAVYEGASFDDAGYVVEIGGRRIFHPGDSILEQQQLALKNIDVLLVSVTEHNTWIENSVRLIEALRPRLALPMHYDTYTLDIFWTIGYPREVRQRLPLGLRDRFRPVRQGERVVLADP